MKKVVPLAALLVLGGSSARADTASATLTVTAQVVSSISLTIESAGGSASGLGTAAATTALGSIGKFSTPPSGFSLARGASNWTLSSNKK